MNVTRDKLECCAWVQQHVWTRSKGKSQMKPPYTVTTWPAAPSPQSNVLSGHKSRNVLFRMWIVVSLLCAKENTSWEPYFILNPRDIIEHSYKKVARSLKATKTINHYKEIFFVCGKKHITNSRPTKLSFLPLRKILKEFGIKLKEGKTEVGEEGREYWVKGVKYRGVGGGWTR